MPGDPKVGGADPGKMGVEAHTGCRSLCGLYPSWSAFAYLPYFNLDSAADQLRFLKNASI